MNPNHRCTRKNTDFTGAFTPFGTGLIMEETSWQVC
jgi:hypothetical protein